MRNNKISEVTKTRAVQNYITKARSLLLGHVLRMNENTPVKKDLKYLLIKPSALAKKFRGRKDRKLS